MNKLDLTKTRLAVARFACDDSLYNAITNGAQNDDERNKINKLNDCLALVLSEIVNEYFYVYKSEKITVNGGFFAFNDLQDRIVEVIKVTRFGTKANYSLRTDGLEISDGEYEITYAYEPVFNASDTDYPLYGKLTPRVVALGVVAEYLLLCDRFNEATAFNNRFKDALVGVEKKRIGLKIKRRRWL